MFLDLVQPIYNFNLFYAQKLVADLSPDLMCAQPVADRVMNHPAFIIGHLAWVNFNGLIVLGQASPPAAELKEIFGMGQKPQSDPAIYPAKDALVKILEDSHAALQQAVSQAPADLLAQPAPERMRARFPSMGAMLAGMMTSHYAMHLGQLSAWRRAMGLPPVF